MRSTATITLSSHGFRVTDFNSEFAGHLSQFCRRFVQCKIESKVVNGKKTLVRVPDRTFASATKNRREIRLHLNCYEDFKHFMRNCGYNTDRFKVVQLEVPEGRNVQFDFINPDIAPREHQVEWLDYQLNLDPVKVNTKINTLQTGKGKAVSLDTPVKIPGGWKPMGDIKVGDSVIAWDGKPTMVTAVYPQPVKQLYNVAFGDGREVEVCGEHLWEVYYVNTQPHKRWRVVDTMEVQRLLSMPNPRVYVRLIEPENEPAVNHVIHPYAMGLLLGDGGMSENSLKFHKPDPELEYELRGYLHPSLTVNRYDWKSLSIIRKPGVNNNVWIEELRRLQLWGSRSWEKFIPEEYMTGSTEQRLSVVQGLLDTDGTVQASNVGGAVSYCTTSQRMAEQVVYLIRSLGGIAKITEKQKYFRHKGERKPGRPAYQVNIRFKRPSDLFRLPRKKERCIDNGQYNDILKLRVKSVEPTRMGLSQCISVDHPDKLFVVKDFIVTHNTFCAIYQMVKMGKRTVITLMPKYINTWLVGLADFVKLQPEDIMVVQGSLELNAAMKLADSGKLTAKIIIVSLPTYQYFMAEYEDNDGAMKHYDYTPDQFWDVMEPGLLVVDEGHESIHALYRFDLYCNVRNKVVLSATLEADDPFINEMYAVVYPKAIRFRGGEYDKYIESVALMYGLTSTKKIKYAGFGGTYSHVKLEQCILKDRRILDAYVKFIGDTADYFFFKVAETNMRLLIYCATVDMCIKVVAYMRHRHDGSGLVINKYTQEDPKTTLNNSDITISTLMSAGTGVDIPGLRTVIMTVAIGSKQKNDQALGRLRRLKDFPDVTPTFVYFVCGNIRPHMEYHRKKLENFANKTLSQRSFNSGFSL